MTASESLTIPTAFEALAFRIANVESLLRTLTYQVDREKRFADPVRLDWGYVGSMTYVEEQLSKLVKFLAFKSLDS